MIDLKMNDEGLVKALPLMIASLSLFGGGFYVLITRPFFTAGVCFWVFCGTGGAPLIFGIDANIWIATIMFALGTVIIWISTRGQG
jgi:hypothetical protein